MLTHRGTSNYCEIWYNCNSRKNVNSILWGKYKYNPKFKEFIMLGVEMALLMTYQIKLYHQYFLCNCWKKKIRFTYLLGKSIDTWHFEDVIAFFIGRTFQWPTKYYRTFNSIRSIAKRILFFIGSLQGNYLDIRNFDGIILLSIRRPFWRRITWRHKSHSFWMVVNST